MNNLEIILQNTSIQVKTPTVDQIQLWLKPLTEACHELINPQARQLVIRFVDKEESARLNSTYRQRPGPTNILSFADDPIPGFSSDSLGDLVICASLVVEEAQQQEKTLESHWAHLLIHGVLHLLGFDHIDEQQAEIMESLEIRLLAQLNYPNPYE